MEAQDLNEPHLPTLEQMQQWTEVVGRAQQLMLEQAAGAAGRTLPFDPQMVSRIQTGFANEGLALWQRFLDSGGMLRDRPNRRHPAARRRARTGVSPIPHGPTIPFMTSSGKVICCCPIIC